MLLRDKDLKIYIHIPATMENSMNPPSRDILDSSSDLHLPVFRIRQ